MPTRPLHRVLFAVPTLLGLTLLVFLLISFSPGGVSAGLETVLAADTGASRDAERIRYLEHRYGLDQPILIQYTRWLAQLSPIGPRGLGWPDLGFSFGRSRPVWDCIKESLAVTLTINVFAYALMYAVAVPAGILCAARRNTWIDRTISSVFAVLWSIPAVCMAVALLGLFATRNMLGWCPSGGLHSPDAASALFLPSFDAQGRFAPGWALDSAHRLVLPVICQAYAGIAVVTRLVRAGVIENLSEPFVRTARAKGVPERDVVIHHAFRAGMLPLVTVFASTFPAMLSGSIVVERVFSLPGMGRLMIEAVDLRDRELLMGITLIAGITTMLAVALADVLYRVIDPRTRRA